MSAVYTRAGMRAVSCARHTNLCKCETSDHVMLIAGDALHRGINKRGHVNQLEMRKTSVCARHTPRRYLNQCQNDELCRN